MENEIIQNGIKYFNYIILDKLKGIKCWVAGGSIASYFGKHTIDGDVDIFFPNKEEFDKAYNRLISTPDDMNQYGKLIFKNDRVVTIEYNKHIIQLVSAHFYDNPKECINSFDFTITCAAIDGKILYTLDTFWIDLAGRRLVINKLPYPLSTLQRMQKYIKKGYSICNGGILELAKGIQTIDFSNPTQNHIEFYPDKSVKFLRID
jgi:predicted oxidoreductase